MLAVRDGCTADACDAFGLVYDDKKLRANMKDRLFDITVARYAANWPTRTRPVASSGFSGSSGPITPPGPNVQFPSSQSIPPVSIMTAEPPPAPSPPPQAQSQSQSGANDAAPPINSAPASATKKSNPPRAAAKKAPRADVAQSDRQAIG